VITQFTSGLQAHRSAYNCLAGCLCNVASYYLSTFINSTSFNKNFSLHVLFMKLSQILDIYQQKTPP